MSEDRFEDHLRSTLRSKADQGAPASDPWGLIRKRGSRALWVKNISYLAMALVIATGAAVFVPRLLDADDTITPAGGPGPVAVQTPTPIPTASDSGSCDYSEFEPTYLPWLEEDEEAPPPKKEKKNKDAVLHWEDEDDTSEIPATVELATEADSTAQEVSDEGYPTVNVKGQKGYLVWVGDPGVGELVVTWQEKKEPCEAYSLTLLDQDFDQAKAEAEIDKVAKSLKRKS